MNQFSMQRIVSFAFVLVMTFPLASFGQGKDESSRIHRWPRTRMAYAWRARFRQCQWQSRDVDLEG